MAGLSTAQDLSIQDLVILGLLAERALHGYEIQSLLERRGIRRWADLSRPQIYYSLKKLERGGCIARLGEPEDDPPGGPDRAVYGVTQHGSRQLRAALAREEWAGRSLTPPFATWLALSPLLPQEESRRVLMRRAEFLRREIALRLAAPEPDQAALGVELVITLLSAELEFIERGLGIRRPARRPAAPRTH